MELNDKQPPQKRKRGFVPPMKKTLKELIEKAEHNISKNEPDNEAGNEDSRATKRRKLIISEDTTAPALPTSDIQSQEEREKSAAAEREAAGVPDLSEATPLQTPPLKLKPRPLISGLITLGAAPVVQQFITTEGTPSEAATDGEHSTSALKHDEETTASNLHSEERNATTESATIERAPETQTTPSHHSEHENTPTNCETPLNTEAVRSAELIVVSVHDKAGGAQNHSDPDNDTISAHAWRRAFCELLPRVPLLLPPPPSSVLQPSNDNSPPSTEFSSNLAIPHLGAQDSAAAIANLTNDVVEPMVVENAPESVQAINSTRESDLEEEIACLRQAYEASTALLEHTQQRHKEELEALRRQHEEAKKQGSIEAELLRVQIALLQEVKSDSPSDELKADILKQLDLSAHAAVDLASDLMAINRLLVQYIRKLRSRRTSLASLRTAASSNTAVPSNSPLSTPIDREVPNTPALRAVRPRASSANTQSNYTSQTTTAEPHKMPMPYAAYRAGMERW